MYIASIRIDGTNHLVVRRLRHHLRAVVLARTAGLESHRFDWRVWDQTGACDSSSVDAWVMVLHPSHTTFDSYDVAF